MMLSFEMVLFFVFSEIKLYSLSKGVTFSQHV